MVFGPPSHSRRGLLRLGRWGAPVLFGLSAVLGIQGAHVLIVLAVAMASWGALQLLVNYRCPVCKSPWARDDLVAPVSLLLLIGRAFGATTCEHCKSEFR